MLLLRARLTVILLFIFTLPFCATSHAQESLTIADFEASPDVFDAEFSPDGRYLAMIIKDEKRRMLIIRDFDNEGLPVTGLMASDFSRPNSVSWASNERLIVNLLIPVGISEKKFRRRSQKNPDFDLDEYRMASRSIAMNVEVKNLSILIDHSKYSARNFNMSKISNFLVNDDEHVLIPLRGYRSRELHKVNLFTGKTEEIAKGTWRTYEFLSDENGRPTYRLDYYYYGKKIRVYEYTDDDSWDEVDEISLNQNDDESLNQEGLLRFGFGNNNELIYRERNKDTGYYEIIRRTRGGGKYEVIASLPNKDIHSPIFDRRTNRYLGYSLQDDVIRNVYDDPKVQVIYDKIVEQLNYSNFSLWSSRTPGKRVVVNAYSADNAGSFYYFDYDTQKLTFLSDKYKSLVPEKLAKPWKLSYKTRDDVKISMYVLLPPNYNKDQKMPMVIIPHGGPHVRDSLVFDSFAQFISTRGYIVIQPNFRGSSGYGLEFEKAGHKQWGGIMQDDLTDAVQFMIDEGYADAERVCIVGGSYGGYAALMGAVKTPDLYQCSVSLNGVTHLKDQIEFDVDTARANEEQIEKSVHERIGHPIRDSAMLDANSPALHAEKIKIPILIIAGENDQIVPIEQSEKMVDALEDHDKKHLYFELEDTGHNVFYYKEDINKVYTEVEKFLAEHLKKVP